MNKTELVAKVAEKAEVTKKVAAQAVDAVFGTIAETLAAKEKVQMIGFGTFEVRSRAARTGHNPQDPKKKIKIAACEVPAFKAGKKLKEAVNVKKPAKKGKAAKK